MKGLFLHHQNCYQLVTAIEKPLSKKPTSCRSTNEVMAPISSRSLRGLTFIFCRFLAHLTSTLHVKCFRIQSSRPFITRNVNGMKLDMSDEPVYDYAPRRLPDLWQRDAILSQNSAILVIAGPGSGKTRVMAARLANLLYSGTCRASECLVLSFTSSAATNLLDKTREIMRLNSGNVDVATTNGVFCDTFHGFCNTVIQENIYHLMETREFYIASDDDQMKIMTDLMESNRMPAKKSEVRKILNLIRYWKELGLGFSGVRKNSLTSEIEQRAYFLYPRYQSKLKSMSALDFGDLLLNTLRLFRQHPEVLDRYRSRFRHILVDEFQDVSPAQYDILRMLVMGSTSGRFDMAAGGAGGLTADEGEGKTDRLDMYYSDSKRRNRVVNVFCAGDDDQSIYAHRGASVESMNRFRFDFPGSTVMKFGISYRLPDAICRATQSFISTTIGRIQKPLVSFQTTFTSPVGIPSLDMRILEDENFDDFSGLNLASTRASIEIRGMQHEEDEVNWVATYLKDTIARAARLPQDLMQQRSSNLPSIIHRDGSGDYSIAVLARSGQRLKMLEDRLRSDEVPFSSRNFGFGNQNEEDTSPLNLLRLIASPDDDVAFQAALDNDIILSSITLSELQSDVMVKVRQVSAEKNFSLLEATRYCVLNKELSELQAKAIAEFFRKFQVWSTQSKLISKGETAERIVEDILKSAFPQRFSKIQKAVTRLCKSAAEYDSLKQFIAAIQLEGVFIDDSGSRVSSESGISDPSSSQNSITLQTRAAPKVTIWLMEMHAAKGLEFNEVILPFWSKGLIQDHPEERKLAFMSLTRAKERVMISYAKNRRVDNTLTLPAGASQFVESLKHIPGLKMKYEDVDYQRFPNLLSKEQQRSIYEVRNADSLSSSHRDTTSILSKDTSKIRAGMARNPTRNSPPTTKNIGNANTFRDAEGFQEPISVPQLGSFTNSLNDGEDDDGDDEALSDENAHHSYLKPEILAIMSPDRLVTPSKGPLKKASVKGVSSASSVGDIILKTVVANVEKKKTKGVPAPNEDVLSKFVDPAKCTHAYVTKLLEEVRWKKSDLAIYFRKVLEVQFGVKRGSIQVSPELSRSLSACTGSQLGEHLLGRLRSRSVRK